MPGNVVMGRSIFKIPSLVKKSLFPRKLESLNVIRSTILRSGPEQLVCCADSLTASIPCNSDCISGDRHLMLFHFNWIANRWHNWFSWFTQLRLHRLTILLVFVLLVAYSWGMAVNNSVIEVDTLVRVEMEPNGDFLPDDIRWSIQNPLQTLDGSRKKNSIANAAARVNSCVNHSANRGDKADDRGDRPVDSSCNEIAFHTSSKRCCRCWIFWRKRSEGSEAEVEAWATAGSEIKLSAVARTRK